MRSSTAHDGLNHHDASPSGRSLCATPADPDNLKPMATAKFILQGFTASTHGGALRWLFDLLDVQTVLISVAYVSEGGVEQVEAYLAQHAACSTVFVGVRNDTTSYQGLVRLHGVVHDLYTVDTGSRTLIFHPKLYLVRGSEHARVMIGSSSAASAQQSRISRSRAGGTCKIIPDMRKRQHLPTDTSSASH
jgi:hypothetical protein